MPIRRTATAAQRGLVLDDTAHLVLQAPPCMAVAVPRNEGAGTAVECAAAVTDDAAARAADEGASGSAVLVNMVLDACT